MDILRIATAGSVDDGKSTLIGRLLYETNTIPQDKLANLADVSKRKGLNFTDLSLLTDGLIAEREQGITIDVAHIYFHTPHRKYIIADTPGHVEYTRNMVTGASTAHVAISLIDARKGVSEQTRRHLALAALLRLEHIVVAVNKMDLVEFDQVRFQTIQQEVEALANQLHLLPTQLSFIPISALHGDNVVVVSQQMTWYQGLTLLQQLENFPINDLQIKHLPTRLPVQYVIRPKTDAFHDFRGYAGRVVSGQWRVGDEVMVLPSKQLTYLTGIQQFTTACQVAEAGSSVVVTLADDVDVSRGNLLCHPADAPKTRQELCATLCWFDEATSQLGKTYWLQHGVNRQKAKITQLHWVLDIATNQGQEDAKSLDMNEIGRVSMRLAQPIFADTYQENKANGAFILIDEQTNATVAVGFIED